MLEDIIETRSIYIKDEGKGAVEIIKDGGSHYASCVMPIIASGDIIGAVISAWQEGLPAGDKVSDSVEMKLVQTAGIFLGKQMES